jgi:hypothetical protein
MKMKNEMEKILGGKIDEGKKIRGQILIEGKEFVYFLGGNGNSLYRQFWELIKFTESCRPKVVE